MIQSRRFRRPGHVGDGRGAETILVGRPDGKR